jgi:hypothetical protein
MRIYAADSRPPSAEREEESRFQKNLLDRAIAPVLETLDKARQTIGRLVDPVTHIAVAAILMIIVLDLRSLLVIYVSQHSTYVAKYLGYLLDGLAMPFLHLPVLALFVAVTRVEDMKKKL